MHSNVRLLVTVAIIIVFISIISLVVYVRLRPTSRRLKDVRFQERWQEVQKLCRADETWPLAVVNADKLVDQALKASRVKGKTMGERLVAAQRRLSDNDGVWFGHKLRNKVVHEEMPQLKQRDVQTALRGFRQALKDLGALL